MGEGTSLWFRCLHQQTSVLLHRAALRLDLHHIATVPCSDPDHRLGRPHHYPEHPAASHSAGPRSPQDGVSEFYSLSVGYQQTDSLIQLSTTVADCWQPVLVTSTHPMKLVL